MERARQRRLIEVLRLSGWAAERPDVAAITVPHGFLQVCGLAPPNPESCAKVYCPGFSMYCTVWNSCIRDPAGRPIILFRISGGNQLMTACRSVVDRPTNMHPRRIETDPISIVVWFGSWVATSSLHRNSVRGRHSQHRCTAHTVAQHCAPYYMNFNTDCCDEIAFYAALATYIALTSFSRESVRVHSVPRQRCSSGGQHGAVAEARVRLLAKATLCGGSQKPTRRQLMAWKGCPGCEAHAVGSCEQGCVVLCVESGKFSPHVCHRSAVCLCRCEANLGKREHACVDLCTSWLKRRGSSRPCR